MSNTKDHVHKLEHIFRLDPNGGKPFRYRCLTCGKELKIASGIYPVLREGPSVRQ